MPESDSARLGGNINHPLDTHVSIESKGKQKLPRVVTDTVPGIDAEFLLDAKGAIEIGNCGSKSLRTNEGDQDNGLFLSPSEKIREKR